MMLTTIQTLQQMRVLLTSSEAWTQREFARNADGFGCISASQVAVAWCLTGAGKRVSNNSKFSMSQAYETLSVITGRNKWGISVFNDDPNTTHAHVLGLLDYAIENLEELEADD